MKTYSEKEKLIFSGVLSLIAQGNDLAGITTQQIALAAGIGKSTIYDYFTTKNDVITNSILYAMNGHVERIKSTVDSAQGFHGKMDAIFRQCIESQANISFLFNTVTAYGGIGRMIEQAKNSDVNRQIQYLSDTMRELFISILLLGKDEGVIALDCTSDYAQQAFIAAVGSVCPPRGCCQDNEQIQRRIDNAYTMLVKALN